VILVQQVSADRVVAAIKKQHKLEIEEKERERASDARKHKKEMTAKDKQHQKEQAAAAKVHGQAVAALNKDLEVSSHASNNFSCTIILLTSAFLASVLRVLLQLPPPPFLLFLDRS